MALVCFSGLYWALVGVGGVFYLLTFEVWGALVSLVRLLMGFGGLWLGLGGLW